MPECENPTVIEGQSFCPVILGPLQSPVAETVAPVGPQVDQLADTGLGADPGWLGLALLAGGLVAYLLEVARGRRNPESLNSQEDTNG